ncbi:MAG: hypothetical protein HXX81_07200, partial [Campylobacterales bacterium]|nr:hypothetical protein [Campylobacterales bacterium]
MKIGNKDIFKLKLTALTPIHIGTGEDFEPTNYVCDYITDKNGQKKDRLFEFREVDFIKALNKTKKAEFMRLVNDTHEYARFKLYDFIYKNREIAKKVAFNNIQVLEEVAKEYHSKIGKVVQKEGKGKNVFNDFFISRTFYNHDQKLAIIPGSSIKGSISTAYQEFYFKKLGDYEKVKELFLKPDDKNIFKNFLVSDTKNISQST